LVGGLPIEQSWEPWSWWTWWLPRNLIIRIFPIKVVIIRVGRPVDRFILIPRLRVLWQSCTKSNMILAKQWTAQQWLLPSGNI
jgi:hypothetical protein